uniref:glycerol kinase n=1 Tax=Elaeophora elaphi TaxID=1147741 RepID=A0A0R3RT10_9BILA
MEFENKLIGAIDHSTSSTRFVIYQLNPRKIVAFHQAFLIEIEQIFPHPGWVELNPEEMISKTLECIDESCNIIKKEGFDINDIKAIGICNQRETTILWDSKTGKAVYNAICWLDDRTTDLVRLFIKKTSTSALKIRWLLDNVDEVKNVLEQGTLMFGTVDSWLIYKLTGKHITDVTNASRTLLMSLQTLNWSKELCDFFEIPMSILPKIHSSAEVYATISLGSLEGIPISGCLGDQQAAMFGEYCFQPGETKCTFGTVTFMLTNIGTKMIISENGMITTVAYQNREVINSKTYLSSFSHQLGSEGKVCYALEGSGSIGGNAIRFLRDNWQLFSDVSEVEPAAASISGVDGIVFVPCFTGLYTPYWDSTARGILCGLVQTTKKEHIIRAVLEAVCFQAEEMIKASCTDMSCNQIKALKVDGGMTVNSLFLQLLSDILGIDVIKSPNTEASSWGAAMAAAIGVQIISFEEVGRYHDGNEFIQRPKLSDDQRQQMIRRWKKAVSRTRGWIQDE